MHIHNHRLASDPGDPSINYIPTPNKGGTLKPRFLIMHYTAGASAKSSIEWLTNKQAKASAHLVIAADGSITQLLPFNVVAWHAGVSSWKELSGLNQHSIGIELDNPGRLTKVGKRWLSWVGKSYGEEVVLEATHKHQQEPGGWHIYTEAQLQVALQVSQLLIEKYKLDDILGHDDVAPHRKQDPGPAFPMEHFRARLFGRKEDKAPRLWVNTEGTNLRSGPSVRYTSLARLPKGTELAFVKRHLNWVFVLVPDGGTAGIVEREGWVHSKLLSERVKDE